MLKNILIKGNSKMGPEVYIYNLPPLKSCAPTLWCKKGRDGKPRCYALRNNFLLPSVKHSLEIRYKFSKQKNFTELMVSAIKKKKVKLFRLHSSGDFYSATYIKKWIEIVSSCPETLFRTTTRRRDLNTEVNKLNKLSNIIIRESLDPYRPTPTMNLSFTALDHMEIAQEDSIYSCPDNCPECDYHCWTYKGDVKFKEF